MKFSDGVKCMIISIVAFSVMHLCVKLLPRIPIFEIIMARSVFSLIMCLIVLRKKHINPWGNNKKVLILRGIVGLLGLTFFFTSVQNIPLASAITISNLMPVFTLLLAMLILKEKVSPYKWIILVFAFIGVYLIKGFDNRISLPDLFIAVGAAFFAGSAHFIVRKLRESESPSVIIFYFPLVTIPVISPFVISNWVSPEPDEWLILSCVAVFTHIGQWFLTKAYQLEEVSNVAHIYFLGVVLALLYGYLFFGESFSIPSLAGMLLIVGAVVLNVKLESIFNLRRKNSA